MRAAIEVQGLTKQYAGATVVRDVSFMVEHDEIFGIIGPNGAGKSTTVECIEGLRKPDAGHISVLGLNPGRDRDELRERLGVQLQDAELPQRLRVGEALRLYSSFYAAPADWRALMETLGLAGQQKTQFGKLSGGQRQRLSIALALVGRPEVVVLDELTTGLDPQARRDTWAPLAITIERAETSLPSDRVTTRSSAIRSDVTSHGLFISAPNFWACTSALAVSSAPARPDGKPRWFSIRALAPACPPTATPSSTSVSRLSRRSLAPPSLEFAFGCSCLNLSSFVPAGSDPLHEA
jgi:ABC-type Na+ transport system ATPase subunit NatA